MPFLLYVSLQNQGPFPTRALPRFSGSTDPSATLTARPAPHGVSVRPVLATGRASRVATSFIFHACQCQYPGGYSLVLVSFTSQTAIGLPPVDERVGFRIAVFGACSAFTRVPACMVAETPKASLVHQSASVHVVTSINRPGCSQPERQVLSGIRTRKKEAPYHGARLPAAAGVSARLASLLRGRRPFTARMVLYSYEQGVLVPCARGHMSETLFVGWSRPTPRVFADACAALVAHQAAEPVHVDRQHR